MTFLEKNLLGHFLHSVKNNSQTPVNQSRFVKCYNISVVPSFPENVLGSPKNRGTTYQWVAQDVLENPMKVQNVLIPIDFMVVSVILQIMMVQDLVDPCFCNFRSYSRNKMCFS